MHIIKDAVVTITCEFSCDGDKLTDRTFAYLHGHGNLHSNVEECLEGKDVGEEVRVEFPLPAYDYMQIETRAVESDDIMQREDMLRVNTSRGERIARISLIDGEDTTLDFNHPLAGRSAHYYIQVIDIREATAEELRVGVAIS